MEHAGWQRAADAYADGFGGLTTQCVDRLLDVVGVRAGTRLLDVATGPGYVAAMAAARGAAAIGLDLSEAMVARATVLAPLAQFRQGSAEALPFEDGRFDAVVINFGLFHFSDPDRALAEALRVLCPGGRFAFTASAKPDRAKAYEVILGSIAEHGEPV